MGQIEQALLIMILVVPMVWFWDKVRPKRILVVEDNPNDVMLFKINIHIDNCIVDYRNSAEGVIREFWRRKPDVVIVDYYLAGKTKGDELLKFCENNNIPSLLVTGNEGEILGVKPERIVRKSADKSYYLQLENFINEAIS